MYKSPPTHMLRRKEGCLKINFQTTSFMASRQVASISLVKPPKNIEKGRLR